MEIDCRIKSAWELRLNLWAEGGKLRAECDNLWAEGDKLRAEGGKLMAEGDKLRAEGDKLWAEGGKLRAEGDKLRAEGDITILSAVVEIYGNIQVEWKNWNEKHDSNELHLENGIVLGFDD